MTPFFILRLFEEHGSLRSSAKKGSEAVEDDFEAHMSLEDFSDFVLAWNHRSEDFGLKYFFPVFDLRHAGCLSQVAIICLLRSGLSTEYIEAWNQALDLVKCFCQGQLDPATGKSHLNC